MHHGHMLSVISTLKKLFEYFIKMKKRTQKEFIIEKVIKKKKQYAIREIFQGLCFDVSLTR